ncbi:MAG: ATP-dependent DNA ligase, partial [Acidimicrobiales bacterium]
MSPEQRTVIEVDGRRLSVSNLDKVLYPEACFTKADVIWYYVHVAPFLLPHVQGRPLTMTRYPDGVTGKSFFEKHSAR